MTLALLMAVEVNLYGQPLETPERDRIGFARLQSELGARLPTGTSVRVALVEGGGESAPGDVVLNFPGKSLEYPTGIKTYTDHAVSVGKLLFGEYSVTPGIQQVDVLTAGSWGGQGILRRGTLQEPAKQRCDIESHSWVHITDGPEMDADTLGRIDYMAERDGVLVVSALANESISKFPALPCAAYNAMTVGVSRGEHSRGGTPGDGRMKPDLVVPVQYTSAAAPLTASSAALLLNAARANKAWSAAARPIVLKALLMAGAVKLPGWSRSAEKPLDAVSGAGELNIYNSYKLLASGRQAGGKGEVAPASGWMLSQSRKPSEWVFFTVRQSGDFSAVLVWNREVRSGVAGGGWGRPEGFVPRLELTLYEAVGGSPGKLVDKSASRIDNVQHVYQRQLAAGSYALEVSNQNPGNYWALAWRAGAGR